MKSGIINLRKQIFNTLKEKAYSYEGNLSGELIEYKRNQSLLSNRDYFQSNINELLNSVSEASVIYLGDFHTFDQNIRNVLRIVKQLIQNDQECIISLEMVAAKYQIYIDSYLDGHITDLEFLESIEYHDSWRFPWSHYKEIFELAKKSKIKVIGLNIEGKLSQRDNFAAKLIKDTLKNNNISKVLVVYGELHISNNKIPKLVNFQNEYKQTIIHQNLDEVYWRQVENNEDIEFIKFSDDEFCINSAPPWIKYESMIYWYENLCDDPDFDIHEYIIEKGKKIFGDDTQDNFSILCKQLILACNLNVSNIDYENYNLYDHTRLDFIESSLLELDDIEEIKFYGSYIAKGFSFKLPNKNSYYCSSYSVNRLAYLSGIHIFNTYKEEQLDNIPSIFRVKSSTQIVAIIYEYMFAYFFSKIINPHRKCSLYRDFIVNQSQSKVFSINRSILDSTRLKDIVDNNTIEDLIFSSIDVGHVLGEYLYQLTTNQAEQSEQIKQLLHNLKFDDFSFQATKKKILENFDYKQHLKRYF